MAQAQDYLSALETQHPGSDLSSSSTLQGLAQTAATSQQPINDFVNNNLNHPAIGQAYTDYAMKQVQPSINAVNTQIGTLNSAKDLSDQATTGAMNTENNTADNNVRNMQVAGYQQQDNLANTADASGVGKSGGYLTGTNNANQDVTRGITYTDGQRANAIAQLGIGNQQNKNQIQGTIDGLNSQNAATTAAAVQSARQQNLQDTNDVYNRNLDMFKAGQGLAQGRSVQIAPGYTINGTVNDTQGFLTALTSLMPLANASSDPAGVLRSYVPSLQNQYGVNAGGDVNAAIAHMVGAAKGQAPTLDTSSGVGGGGSTKVPASSNSSVLSNIKQLMSPQSINPMTGKSFYGSGDPRQDYAIISEIYQNEPGLSWSQATNLYNQAKG